MNQLAGYVINTTMICHFQKVLYGLKNTLCIWYTMILEFLQRLKFTKTDADYNIFVSYSKSTFILVYVDNFLIIDNDLEIINDLKNGLSKHF